jgi:hypothetical protein
MWRFITALVAIGLAALFVAVITFYVTRPAPVTRPQPAMGVRR